MRINMKYGKLKFGLAACAIVLMFAMAGVVGASDIGATIKQTCSRCHSTKRICLNLGVKNKASWKSTVNKMVGKGAKLPADQIDAAVGYLSGLAPGTGTVCQ